MSEAGAQANAICLSLAETAKANGIDFYQYLVKLLTDLPNLLIHQQPEILHNYLPWSENIQATCAKYPASRKKFSASWPFVVRTVKVRYFLYFGLTINQLFYILKQYLTLNMCEC